MKKTILKGFALILALCILFGALPLSASAEDSGVYAINLSYDSRYGFAKVGNSVTEASAGSLCTIYVVLNDACAVDNIVITDTVTNEPVSWRYRGTKQQLDTLFHLYEFKMPSAPVDILVSLVPVQSEKQIELTTDDYDLGFLRVSNDHDYAIPTSRVEIFAIPYPNDTAGYDNVVEGVTCTTVSGVSIQTRYEGKLNGFFTYSFTMPDEDVIVRGYFAAPRGWHRLEKQDADHGTITLPAGFAKTNSSVTFTAKPDTGYKINALYYIDRDTGERTDIPYLANQTGFTVAMPDADIIIHAHFGLNDNAHEITVSYSGVQGGWTELSTTVASPGETVSAITRASGHNQVKEVVVTAKSDGSPVDFSIDNIDEFGYEISFTMPDYDVDVCASFIFPSVTVGNPRIFVYDGENRDKREVTYDADTRTFYAEVFEDSEEIELHIIASDNTITVTAPAVEFSYAMSSYFSKFVPLAETVTEMTVLCEADDLNTGDHLSESYTLLISRNKSYVPVERIVLEDGAAYKRLYYTYMPGDWDSWEYKRNTQWMPGVSIYPEEADNKNLYWSSSDESILYFGYNNDDLFHRLDDLQFQTNTRSGVVTITATSPDGVSASMQVVVANNAYSYTVSYDAGDGTLNVPASVTDYSDITRLPDKDDVKVPDGQQLTAWEYNGVTYDPGEWVVLPARECTFSAVYEDVMTIIWLNGDGSVLDSAGYSGVGDEPTTDKIPTKTETDRYTFEFYGWNEGDVNGNVKTYTPFFIPVKKYFKVTVKLGSYGSDVVKEVPRETNFFTAMEDAGVYTELNNMETDDFLFRDLATKPLSKFSNAEAFNADAEALLQKTVTSDMTVYACFFTKIRSVELTLERPVIGSAVTVDEEYNQSPTPVITLADDSHCTIREDSVSWHTPDSETAITLFSGEFAADETYLAELTLTPDFGYWLDGNTVVTANGAETVEVIGSMTVGVTLSTQAVDPTILGDADGDGFVTIFDATAIQRFLAEIPGGDFNEAAADVDRDGFVTIFDATAIQRFLAQMPSPEGIGQPIG